MLSVEFTPEALEDFQYWQDQDRKTLKRILKLIEESLRNPYEGIGKPEQLKHSLAGCWSRRIDDTNRMVYTIQEKRLILLQLRYHY